MFAFTEDRPKAGPGPYRSGARRPQEPGHHVQGAQTPPHDRPFFDRAPVLYRRAQHPCSPWVVSMRRPHLPWTEKEVIQFAIALNVTAGLGAFGFAWIDDILGAKKTLIISIVALAILGTAILLVHDVMWFWILGILLGTFVGPTQSASRSMMARLSPPELTGRDVRPVRVVGPHHLVPRASPGRHCRGGDRQSAYRHGRHRCLPGRRPAALAAPSKTPAGRCVKGLSRRLRRPTPLPATSRMLPWVAGRESGLAPAAIQNRC